MYNKERISEKAKEVVKDTNSFFMKNKGKTGVRGML